uniref:Uncharacterized protein n=1 Tax=Oryza barthii TaxID=65489 RepID=A0A0D3GAE0_9ORYZ
MHKPSLSSSSPTEKDAAVADFTCGNHEHTVKKKQRRYFLSSFVLVAVARAGQQEGWRWGGGGVWLRRRRRGMRRPAFRWEPRVERLRGEGANQP